MIGNKYFTNKILPRGVICPSKMTCVDQKTLSYMSHGREMAMSSDLIYIYILFYILILTFYKNEGYNSNIVIKWFIFIISDITPKQGYLHSIPFLYFKTSKNYYLVSFHSILFYSLNSFHFIPFSCNLFIPFPTKLPNEALKNQEILLPSNRSCSACSQGKLITRPLSSKVDIECPSFLERIQGDICGPIYPPCGSFGYFMVLIYASTRWSHVCLLSTRNVTYARLFAQIIRLSAQFPEYPIKKICLDNAGEFTFQAFNDYSMSIGMDVEHLVTHINMV